MDHMVWYSMGWRQVLIWSSRDGDGTGVDRELCSDMVNFLGDGTEKS